MCYFPSTNVWQYGENIANQWNSLETLCSGFVLGLRYVSMTDSPLGWSQSPVSEHDPKPPPQSALLVFLAWPASTLNHIVSLGLIPNLSLVKVTFFTTQLQHAGGMAWGKTSYDKNQDISNRSYFLGTMSSILQIPHLILTSVHLVGSMDEESWGSERLGLTASHTLCPEEPGMESTAEWLWCFVHADLPKECLAARYTTLLSPFLLSFLKSCLQELDNLAAPGERTSLQTHFLNKKEGTLVRLSRQRNCTCRYNRVKMATKRWLLNKRHILDRSLGEEDVLDFNGLDFSC